MRQILLPLLATCALALPSLGQTPTTERVSVDSAGVQGNSHSGSPSISADGRFAAFTSGASNLVPGDTNGVHDIFVHDLQTGQTTRVSVDSTGVQGNGNSFGVSISADGRSVAFHSYAGNLVPGDTNGWDDIFVHDRLTGQTARVSVDSAGAQGNGGGANVPSISADDRFVAFSSSASNLVPGDTNGTTDVFVHDRQTGQTTRVSMDSNGVQGSGFSYSTSISADGRFVAFTSSASNLVPGDTNAADDIFVHNRQTGLTTRVSVDFTGAQGNGYSRTPSISADGRSVAFQSYASNLVAGDTNGIPDTFVHDRQTGLTTRVSVDSTGAQGNGYSSWPSISADGRFVAFFGNASNLVPGDTNNADDVFVHDRQTTQTTRVSVDSAGVQGNSYSRQPSISADGRLVAFACGADNLVPGDTNGADDIFVHDRGEPGFMLATSGTCPGPMTLTASNGTPGGTVAFVWGTSGSFTIPAGNPCAGTLLDLVPLLSPPPGYLLATADGSGTATASILVPSGACGTVRMQAVDLSSCTTSNTASL
ncbi:MAG: calcium-binding protein [Planctomycetota bacterium]|nr:MAG: calcium-binding protein [Planctomycetota bacterium]